MAARLNSRFLTLNAILLYITAYLLTIVLHELGHATVSALLGGQPILYNTSVVNTNPAFSDMARVLVAAAGPVVSLLQGMALLVVVRRSRAGGQWRLFGLYLGVFGLINFLGYLLIAPFVSGGDTGQIVALLHVPGALTWAVAALALGLLVWSIGGTAPLFVGLLPASCQGSVGTRTQGLRGLILWPWLVGSVVLVLLALPAPHPAVVANMFMSPMVLRRTYLNGLKMPLEPTPAADEALQPFPVLAGVAAVAVAIGFWLLRTGIAF